MNSKRVTNLLCFNANRPYRHTLSFVLALAVLICIPQIALAGTITSVNVQASQVNIGQTTQILVQGSAPCTFNLNLDGTTLNNQTLDNQGNYQTPHSWNSAGTKTVTATGKPGGVGGCSGNAQDTVVVVDGTGKPKFEKAKDYYPKVKPKFEKKKDYYPKATFKPRIDSILVVPAGSLKAGSSPGILRPGFKLYLKGKFFGTQSGKIVMSGAGGFVVDLENIKWESDTQVNGVVPMSTNGQPNQSVKIRVVSAKVPQNMFDLSNLSNPWNMSFEGREEKVLTKDAVTVNCSTDANWNFCKDSTDCANDIAICGFHKNKWGDPVNDGGIDSWNINLKNGWKFKSMQKVKWLITGDDPLEYISGPNPSLPVGQSNWNSTITWGVTPNDKVFYKIKVIVEGPLGTSYK